jgi:hypothetical protein
MNEDEKSKVEWARMNRAGNVVNRQKAIATCASIGLTILILTVSYPILLVLWPSNKIPVIFLTLPWFPALSAGWWVRNKLWPGGALGR